MQTALRITNAGIGTPDYPRSRIRRRQPGDKPAEKKKTSAPGKHHGFLTEKIRPFTPDYHIIMDEDTGETLNLTTLENFDYLHRSALRYTQLMGINLPFRKKKGDSPRMNIVKLFKTLENILPEYINLEIVDGRLHFCLYRFHKWPDYRLFWIPIDFTEKLPCRLKKITLEFIRRFVRHHGLQDITDTYYYDMSVEYLEYYGNYDENAGPEKIKSYESLAKSYQKGKIHHILKRMKGRSFCADFEKRMEECHTGTKNEQKLMELMKEGLAFIAPDSPCIMQYYYDWAYEESPDFQPAGLEVLVMLTYSVNDSLCKEMVAYFNSDCQESYAITPVTTLYITPETDKLLCMVDYPEKLADWLDRFIEHVSNNF